MKKKNKITWKCRNGGGYSKYVANEIPGCIISTCGYHNKWFLNHPILTRILAFKTLKMAKFVAELLNIG